MALSQEFRQAIEEQDILMAHIMLKDSLVVDPTFKEFNEMAAFAENKLTRLYEEHDGEQLVTDLSEWTKDYMDTQMVKVVNNFSKERIALLKNICRHLYSKRAEKIENVRSVAQYSPVLTKKQVGAAVTVGGIASAAVGVAVSKPLIIATGVIVAVAGGIMIATDPRR